MRVAAAVGVLGAALDDDDGSIFSRAGTYEHGRLLVLRSWPDFHGNRQNLSRIAICADLLLAARHRHGRVKPPKMPPSRRSGRRPRFLGAPQTRQGRPLVPRLGRAVALPRVIEQELAHEPAEHGGCAAKWGAAARFSQLYGTQCEVAAFGVLNHDEQRADAAQDRCPRPLKPISGRHVALRAGKRQLLVQGGGEGGHQEGEGNGNKENFFLKIG